MNQSSPVLIMGNTFTGNVAFKGVLNIEMAQQQTAPLVIYRNQFVNNSALIEANVLNLRKRNSLNLIGTDYTFSTSLGCGGIDLTGNSFIGNIGCPTANAASLIYCFDPSSTSSFVKYYPSIDSQYFIENSKNTLTLSAPTSSLFSFFYSNGSTSVAVSTSL